MTILGPIFLAILMMAPAYISSLEDTELKTIQVIDQTNVVSQAISNTDLLHFEIFPQKNHIEALQEFKDNSYYAVLFIPENIAKGGNTIEIYSDKDISREVIKHVKSDLEKEIQKEKLRSNGITEDVLKIVETKIGVSTFIIDSEGQRKKSFTDFKMALGYGAGFLIYIFIFMFGAQVMRGVIEEKTNRIIEVIVSSVKPFQLMMGKIVGVALVGLTQFLLWIVLTFTIVTIVQSTVFSGEKISVEKINPESIMEKSGTNDSISVPESAHMESYMEDALDYLNEVNFPAMLGAFLFFFIGGYLLYSSLFAAIGSAVDNDTDTQQFMLPITIPLVLAIIMLFSIVDNPDGQIALWFSMIPFTSPITMMARIPFGVPWWQIIISMVLLVATFAGTTWLAGKIYRIGILMYGKKITYKELWKWLKYKN